MLRRQATDLLTASPAPIAARGAKRNPARRIIASPVGQSKEADRDKGIVAELIPAKSKSHYLLSNQAKRLDNHRQLFPVMSGTGSGSQCPAGLGITAPLNVEYITATTANGGTPRPGRASICSAAQRWFAGVWFDPLGLRRELSPL